MSNSNVAEEFRNVTSTSLGVVNPQKNIDHLIAAQNALVANNQYYQNLVSTGKSAGHGIA